MGQDEKRGAERDPREDEVGAGGGDYRRKEGDEGFGEGLRQGLSMLSAVREALEETVQEAGDRGGATAEQARERLGSTLSRARSAAGEARERLDRVARHELERLGEHLDDLEARVTELGARARRARSPRRGGPRE